MHPKNGKKDNRTWLDPNKICGTSNIIAGKKKEKVLPNIGIVKLLKRGNAGKWQKLLYVPRKVFFIATLKKLHNKCNNSGGKTRSAAGNWWLFLTPTSQHPLLICRPWVNCVGVGCCTVQVLLNITILEFKFNTLTFSRTYSSNKSKQNQSLALSFSCYPLAYCFVCQGLNLQW